MGPRTEPCGTPLSTGKSQLKEFLIFTDMVRLEMKFMIQSSVDPDMPRRESLEKRMLWLTTSNALEKSKSIKSTVKPSSSHSEISLYVRRSWSSVDLPHRKPYWNWERILFDSRWSIRDSAIIRSIVLAQTEVRLIGR